MLQWISQKIQIIDVHYLGNWRIQNESQNGVPRWRRLFAWHPVKLDDGDIIFPKHYWVNETFMQNLIMVQKDTW